jgi:uncharacterized protein YndB with AHSA1/START domain
MSAPRPPSPPVPQPIVAQRRLRLAESIDRVYAFVTHHESLPTWLPPVRSVRVDRSRADELGVGALRVVNPGTAAEARETVVWAAPPHGFAYRADDASLHGLLTEHTSVFELQAAGLAHTDLAWTIHGRLPRGVRGAVGRAVMATVLRLGARGLRRRFNPR